MITAEKAVIKMEQARQSILHAKGLIIEALGETDVGTEYERALDQLVEELELDTADIASGEVYEFRE